MKRRPPLQQGIPRLPGDSIRSQVVDLVFSDILPTFGAAILLSVMAFVEWQATIHHWSRHPLPYGIAALLAIAICIWRFMRAGPRIRALQLGRDGEISVAAMLDGLRASGAHVFHDIPLEKGNIDHVVLSTKGLYAVETKTRSKPTGRRAEISFQGASIAVDGFRPDRDPVDQVQRNVQALKVILERTTKKQFEIKGVVLFPGWWIQPMDAAWIKADRPWVLNPAAFMKWVAGQRDSIPAPDLHLAATHLEQYVRNHTMVQQAVAAQ